MCCLEIPGVSTCQSPQGLSRSVYLPLYSLHWIIIKNLAYNFRLVSHSTTLSITPFRLDNRDAIVFAFCAVAHRNVFNTQGFEDESVVSSRETMGRKTLARCDRQLFSTAK